jgi:hypothetical protein
MAAPRMTTNEARRLFLQRIQKRLAAVGKPPSDFALEYWQALEPEDQQRVVQLWKNSGRRSELDAIEKEFETALCDALQEDVTHDPATVEPYRRALHDITSVEGIQLQALVFAAAMRVKALQTPNRALRTFALLIIVVVLLIGFWIGAHFRR